jgi:hypothetical protein
MKTKKKATKKQKMWALVGLVCVAVVLILFITIGIPMIKDIKNSGYNSKYVYDGMSLVGVWQEKDYENNTCMLYEFKSDKKVVASIRVCGMVAELYSGTYRVEGTNELVITYELDNGVIDNEETHFSISKDDSTLVLKDMDFFVLERSTPEYNIDRGIVGKWLGQQSTFIFNEDNTGFIVENDIKNKILFSTKGEKLYMFINEPLILEGYTFSEKFVIEYEYKIENGTLTLKGADGKETIFQASEK